MDEQRKEELREFIEEARQSTTNYKRFQLNETIPQRLADAIKEVIGIDVSDYKNEIYEDIVRHIEKRHGERGIADHSMKDLSKLERVNDFLESFDEIKSADTSRQFKNSDGSRANTIEIKKDYIVEQGHLIEAVPVNKNKSLEVVSMYYENKIANTEQVPDDFKSPGHTPKTQPTNNVSANKIIGKEKDTVNNQIMKELKNNGFQPTPSLVNNMKKLNELTSQELSIKDVSNMYSGIKDSAVQDTVKCIAKECAEQERARNLPKIGK